MSSCFDNVDISDDDSGMAMDILFKPRVETTEQMTQTGTKQDIFAIQIPRINESAKSHLRDMYVVVVSCFHSILHLKTLTEGTYALNLRRFAALFSIS